MSTSSNPPDYLHGVPDGMQHATFASFDLALNPTMRPAYDTCLAVAEKRQPFAFLVGGTGRGKTHLAIAAMRVFGPLRSVFWRVPDFIEWANDWAYGKGFGMTNTLRAYLKGDFLLVFDDLGTEKRTEKAGETLFRVLDSRSADRLPTIITSNVSPLAIDERVRSRYREGKVECRGVDVRGQLR